MTLSTHNQYYCKHKKNHIIWIPKEEHLEYCPLCQAKGHRYKLYKVKKELTK